MMKKKNGTLKPKTTISASRKSGIWASAVTAAFAVIGAVFMIIGYRNEFLHWMVTTGVAFLVVALIPILVFVYTLINKKIDS